MAPRRLYLLFNLVALICGLGQTVQGAGPGREEVHIRRGVELRRKGRDKEALVNFRRAYEVSHTARAAAQLGLCEQALEQWLPSFHHLSDALASQSDVWISEHRTTLEKAFGEVQGRLGRVEVNGTPGVGVVVVAGEVVGNVSEGVSVAALPGTVSITVTADGYARLDETRQVSAGQHVMVTVSLKPLDTLSAKVTSANTSAAPSSLEGNRPNLTDSLRAGPGVSPRYKAVTYSLLAGGGVLIAAGGILAMRSSSLAKEASASATYDASKDDSAQSTRTAGFVCAGTGATMIAVGAFLYFRSDDITESALAPQVSGNSASLLWKGSF